MATAKRRSVVETQGMLFDVSESVATADSDCGANAPGGGGFQKGNTCAGDRGGVATAKPLRKAARQILADAKEVRVESVNQLPQAVYAYDYGRIEAKLDDRAKQEFQEATGGSAGQNDKHKWLWKYRNEHPEQFRAGERDVLYVSPGESAVRFSTSKGGQYYMQITLHEDPVLGTPAHNIRFADEQDDTGITKAGASHEVFSAFMKHWSAYASHQQPDVMTFFAHEPSRRRLYDRLVSTFADIHPEYAAVAYNDAMNRNYVIVKRARMPEVMATLESRHQQLSQKRANTQPPKVLAESDDCGANGPGGGGFQPGNTCGSKGGSGGGTAVADSIQGGGSDTRKGRAEAFRQEILQAAEGVSVKRVDAVPQSEPISDDDYEAIEGSLSADERDELKSYMREKRDEAAEDSRVYALDGVDDSYLWERAGWSNEDMVLKIGDLAERHFSEMTAVNIRGWLSSGNAAGMEGEDGIDRVASAILVRNMAGVEWDEDNDDREGFESGLEDLMSEARSDYDRTRQDMEDSHVDSFEWDSADEQDVREAWLRDFYRDHPERFESEFEEGAWFIAPTDAALKFKTSAGNAYDIQVHMQRSAAIDVEVHDIGFYDDQGKFAVTGAGGAHEVFSQVMKNVTAYAQAQDPTAMTFMAKEPSRRRLYDRIVKSLAAVMPEYSAMYTEDQQWRYYAIVKRDVRDKAKEALKVARRAEPTVLVEQWTDMESQCDWKWKAMEVFCPNGEGGGVDPSCGKDGGEPSAKSDASVTAKRWFADTALKAGHPANPVKLDGDDATTFTLERTPDPAYAREVNAKVLDQLKPLDGLEPDEVEANADTESVRNLAAGILQKSPDLNPAQFQKAIKVAAKEAGLTRWDPDWAFEPVDSWRDSWKDEPVYGGSGEQLRQAVRQHLGSGELYLQTRSGDDVEAEEWLDAIKLKPGQPLTAKDLLARADSVLTKRKWRIVDGNGTRSEAVFWPQVFQSLGHDGLRDGEQSWEWGAGKVAEAFCPTGEGGGIKNDCSPSNKGASAPSGRPSGKRKGTAIYQTPKAEFIEKRRREEIASVEAEWKAKADDLESQLKAAQSGTLDERIVSNIRDNAGMDPETFYRQQLDDTHDTYSRRLTLLRERRAYNWEASVEMDHAKAVKRAVEAGKDVPMEVLQSYWHTDWMPKSVKDKLYVESQLVVLRDERSTDNAKAMAKNAADILEKTFSSADAVRIRVLEADAAYQRGVQDLEDRMASLHHEGIAAMESAQKAREEAGDFEGLNKLPPDDPRKKRYDAEIERFNAFVQQHEAMGKEVYRMRVERARNVWKSMAVARGVRPVVTSADAGLSVPPEVAEFLGTVMNADVHGDTLEFALKSIDPALRPNHRERAYFSSGAVHVSPSDSAAVHVHELGHALEYLNGEHYGKMSKGFFWHQTRDDHGKESHLGANYDVDEVYSPDQFRDAYTGKWYYGNSTEIMSMGMQALFEDPAKFARDSPEHFRYTIAVLHGLIPSHGGAK